MKRFHKMRKNRRDRRLLGHGGAKEIRTPDPHVANVMLYQLSYRPMS